MVIWNELRAVDRRRQEILSMVSSTGMLSDMFERYCGSEHEMMVLVKLGMVEIKRGRVYLTKDGRSRATSLDRRK